MIAIVTIGEENKIVKGEHRGFTEHCKVVIKRPLVQANECTLTICEITENITIKPKNEGFNVPRVCVVLLTKTLLK